MTLAYPIKLEADDNGTFLVTCPDLPEVTTFGEDESDALLHARDAIEEAIAGRIADGREIPKPKPHPNCLQAVLSTQAALKIQLYLTLKEEGITRAELMRRLQWKRPSVDRLFQIDHATRIEQFDSAFRALGRQLGVTAFTLGDKGRAIVEVKLSGDEIKKKAASALTKRIKRRKAVKRKNDNSQRVHLRRA
jgi:antitoxin HicB